MDWDADAAASARGVTEASAEGVLAGIVDTTTRVGVVDIPKGNDAEQASKATRKNIKRTTPTSFWCRVRTKADWKT
jgi:hypothetical protein